MKFTSQNPQYEYLRKRWKAKHRDVSQRVVDKHLKNLAIGSIGGLMLLSSSSANQIGAQSQVVSSDAVIDKGSDNSPLLAAELKDKIPNEMRVLSSVEEKTITELLTKDLGIEVAAELQGKRLNRSYGIIGGEQHLYRYPGDSLYAHFHTAQEWAMYGDAGIAPHLGAWGYFAPSKELFTKKDEDMEKYYIAVQTFLAAGYAENVVEYRDFFKFRKMVLINPETGQTVITVIGDAGPSEYTGKHLGGSPEVMQALGLATGPRKGAVLYFFVNDPEDKIPLGPYKIPDSLIANKR